MGVDGDVVDAVDVGGLRIAFQREGRGPPLMLLHGFVGDGVGTWGYQLEALSDAFTVIAWDCPGAGHSSAAVLALELFRRHRARIVPVGRPCGLSFRVPARLGPGPPVCGGAVVRRCLGARALPPAR